MTTIADIDSLLGRAPAEGGVSSSRIASDGTTMEASLWSVAPGARAAITVPARSDGYWFVLKGTGSIADAEGQKQPVKPQVFAIAGQGSDVTLSNDGGEPLEFLYVISPPPGSQAEIAGYQGGLKTIPAETVALAHEPENKKRRAFFVGPKATPSGRAEGMIVHYEAETVTNPHFHPDADSLFVILEGALEFTNGRDLTTIRPGQAVFINQGHRHGTRVTPGQSGAAFLEFHVPAKFQTIQDP
ncbi:hypothetical protein K32_08230 [Kaistia sp. 32K]|uniref:cupin domain-containing protein n=1 Tax=Kaistia sp. 32K TaxID=2795690 RepID=UPI001915688F|nr:cupin domain-containing protein [Kaistia sp. 32K]BCP52206.1 hypothetical protein K32_08230 [Kaistia sp. 32K]